MSEKISLDSSVRIAVFFVWHLSVLALRSLQGFKHIIESKNLTIKRHNNGLLFE